MSKTADTAGPQVSAARHRLLLALGAAVTGAVLSSLAVNKLSWLDNLEDRAADLRIALFQPPEPQSRAISIIAIDEDTLSGFKYRSPVDRGFLAQLLSDLQARGVRAIGLNLLLDQPTEPEKDALLFSTLRQLAVPVAIAYATSPDVVNARQRAYLDAFVPGAQRATAALRNDPVDSTVRSMPAESAELPAHLVRRLAASSGVVASQREYEIAWRGRPDGRGTPFDIVPAHTLSRLDQDALRGRIVLVGLNVSLTDRHRTPFSMLDSRDEVMMPGVEIQAHALSQLLEARPPPRISLAPTTGLCLIAALAGALLALARRPLAIRLGAVIGIVAAMWLSAIIGYRLGLPMLPLIAPTLALFLAIWAMDFLDGRHERARRRKAQQTLARYVSPAVAGRLLSGTDNRIGSARHQEASFLFSDIEGFTELSERLAPDTLASLLNDYLDGACKVIFEHEGTIDKFIGDGIMVVFNSPVSQPDHAARALRCALSLDRYAEAFRARQSAHGISLGVTRIGLHCGSAHIGSFGSHQRMEFTALGDAVNTASRIEKANRLAGTRVCLSAAVVARYPDPLYLPIGQVKLPGKEQLLMLYTHAAALDGRIELARDYADAYALIDTDRAAAIQAFEALVARYPTAAPAQLHLARLRSNLHSVLIA